MSIHELQTALVKFFRAGRTDQKEIIQRLDELYEVFGSRMILKWRNIENKRNSLLHEFVEREMDDVVRYLISKKKFDINVKRDSDDLTPLQLAKKNGSTSICNILMQLGAEDVETVDVRRWASNDERRKESNIVWMDLEMTSIEDPEILECAVIITDKDLEELERSKSLEYFHLG